MNGSTCGFLIALLLTCVASVAAQLPPEILVDQLLLRVERMIETEETEGALEVVQEILALQEEHAIQLPPEFHFRRAQVTFAAGTLEPARESVTRYVTAAGREGQFYAVALALLEDVERILERRDAPDCAGQPEGTECWMELANQPGCHVWNEGLQLEAVAKWTGACAAGLATGPGTLSWKWPPDNHQEERGAMRLGRHDGHWVETFPNGVVAEGPYEDGEENGHWVIEFPDGGIQEGPYAGGQRNGHWIDTNADGGIGEGSYVDGRRNGRWTWTYPDDQVESGPYENGEKHGQWVIQRPDGAIERGAFAAGKRQGRWTREEPAPDARICAIEVVNDEAVGEWDCRIRP